MFTVYVCHPRLERDQTSTSDDDRSVGNTFSFTLGFEIFLGIKISFSHSSLMFYIFLPLDLVYKDEELYNKDGE